MIFVDICGFDSNHQFPLDMIVNQSRDYILLLLKTDGFFHVEGEMIETPPNTFILCAKGADIRYGRRVPYYNDDWIHFDFEEEDRTFIEELDIPFNTPCVLYSFEQLTEYTRLIVTEKNSSQKNKKQILDMLMRTLLLSLSSLYHTVPDIRALHKHYKIMNDLRNTIHNTPCEPWTIEELARRVNMSESYFQHLYKELFDTTCMAEIIRARLKRAKYYLRATEISIHELSERCGYNNELHFLRQFKKYEGMTPSQYRKLYLKMI